MKPKLVTLLFVVFVAVAHVGAEVTLTDAEGRLRMALQIARERNDRALVAEVEGTGRKILETLKAGSATDVDASLRALESKVGIDPGGWSMAAQPLFHPTAEMLTRSRELHPRLVAAMQANDPARVRAVTAEMLAVLGDQAGVPDGRRAGIKPAPNAIDEAAATRLFLDALASESSRLRPLLAGKPLPDQMLRFYGYLLDATATIRPFVAKHQPGRLAEIDRLMDGLATILTGLQQPAGHFPFPDLRGKNLRFGAMTDRHLAAGQVEVRDGWIISPDPEGGSQFDTGVVRAVVQALAGLSAIDAKRIALYGGSGGGSIALELGADPKVRAVIAGEPATVLYTGMLTTGDYGPRLEMMAAPEKFLTEELRQRTLEKLKTLRAPVLILHSDQHDLRKLNAPLFLPLMKQAGVKVDYREYPGYGHGFYLGAGDDRWGKGADEKVVQELMRDVGAFLEREMPPTVPSGAGADAKIDWTLPPVTAPRVQHHTFISQAAKAEVSFHLYTPEVYDNELVKRFPVLYWLHGTGGGRAGIAPMAAWFDAAIREGKIPPMLVVFPNGLATSMWCDSKDGVVPMETIVVKELVPHIDSTFRTIAKREGRLIEGFSMGGYGAARLGLKHPDVFAGFSCLAGGPLDLDFAGPRAAGNPVERERIFQDTFGGDLDYYRAVSPLTLATAQADHVRGKLTIRIAAGLRDNTGPLNRAFSDRLNELQIRHAFTKVPGVGHDTLALLKGLGEENWTFYNQILGTLKQSTHDP